MKNPVRYRRDFSSCPTRARTWTFLNQNQACCQLHHGTLCFRDPNPYKNPCQPLKHPAFSANLWAKADIQAEFGSAKVELFFKKGKGRRRITLKI